MTGEVLGGGVVVALAAALWLAYLVPTWLRRREFQASERNAVRLQQTLRILAETSEVPNEVRLEATAREVAVQERILRRSRERTLAQIAEQARTQARQDREAALADAAAARATAAAANRDAANRAAADRAGRMPDARGSRARNVRRVRATTSLVLLVGLVLAGWGVAELAVSASWLLFASGLALAGSAILILGRLARTARGRGRAQMTTSRAETTELFDHAEHFAPTVVGHSTWTPRPLPKPLHLSRGTIAASAMASVDAVTQLRRAAARAELERRAAELAPELAPVAQLTPHPAPRSTPATPATPAAPHAAEHSRFARMGVLEQVDADALDLDAVLRRRRAVS